MYNVPNKKTPKKMKYFDAVNFLLSRTDYERWPGYQYANRFDLRRMDILLQRLNNPHLKARTVHIAGSKGKGSTAAMIASGLRAAGYKTGLYTSPHLVTLRERINVNGKSILKRDLIRAVQEIRPHVEAVDRECKYGELSTFELLTAAAFVYFQQENVDFQVLETGLGGRLDATNVASSEVCIITSISLDHTEVLGDTLAKIAKEKGCSILQAYARNTSADFFSKLGFFSLTGKALEHPHLSKHGITFQQMRYDVLQDQTK